MDALICVEFAYLLFMNLSESTIKWCAMIAQMKTMNDVGITNIVRHIQNM